MNIDVVRVHFKDKGCDEYSYKYLPFEYCCDRLKNFDYIEFNAEYDRSGPNAYCDENDNIIPGFSITFDEPVAWEDYNDTVYYRIDYCPFCGQKININIVREEDKSYQYAVMSALRDSKKELSLKTDSKSEYDRLRNEVRDIDAKLDEFWGFGKYHVEQSKNT